jgi:transcriptional regulator GlxA family with amidase domain
MLIEILVFPGVDELDALGPLEVLREATAAGAEFETRLVTLGDVPYITGSHGLRFGVDGTLGSRGRADILIVPGGGWVKRCPEGAWAEVQHREIPRVIRDTYEAGAIVASVCTGAMLIAATGLLRGRRAITHHDAINELREYGAEIVQARVVDDDDIVTAGGVAAGLDLALHFVERFCGANLANDVALAIEYQRCTPVSVKPDRVWGLFKKAAP